MRVLIVTGSLPPQPCGVGDYTAMLAANLAAQPGISIAVLTSADPTPAAIPGVELFPLMTRWSLAEARHFIRLVRRWKPDIVHVQFPTQGYRNGALASLIPLLTRFLGIRLVRTWHEFWSRAALSGKTGLVRALAHMLPPGDVIVVRPNFRDQLAPLAERITRRLELAFIPNASSIPVARLTTDEYARLRGTYVAQAERLIVFFGFIYPNKGVERIFEIADPTSDRILVLGQVRPGAPYDDMVAGIAAAPPWAGRVVFAGFMPPAEVAARLAAADAVVLPFTEGAGSWNSSVHAAVRQGTPVVTTSATRIGFDAEQLIDFSPPGDIASMRKALDRVVGTRRPASDSDEWPEIARAHADIYRRPRGLAA